MKQQIKQRPTRREGLPYKGSRGFNQPLCQEVWALARLSPEHRAVIDELYYRGATVTQAAQTLGLRPGTVKSRSYYAIRALRTAFEEMGVER